MKKIIIFLAIIVFVVCPLSEEKREEMRKKRKERDKFVVECILKDESVSPEIRKKIEDNKDEELRKVLPLISKLGDNDRNIVRRCRKEYIDKLREDIVAKKKAATHSDL